MTRRSYRLTALAVWSCAALIGGILAAQRFAGATNAGQPDLSNYFLPAAQAIAAGESPYTVPGYFYSPLVALLLVPFAESDSVEQAWTIIRLGAGVTACVIAAFAFTPRGAMVRTAAIAAFAVLTLLWSWPVTVSLWLGQVELIVLLALALTALAESRGNRLATGFALGFAALVKTWPALFAIWLLRKGWRGRGKEWLGVALAAALAVLAALVLAGPRGVVDMVSSPFAGTNQDLAANSAWGIGKLLFSETPIGDPIIDSAPLRWTVSLGLAVVLIALLVLNLMQPGPPAIALFNTVLLVILLLPVSHFFYAILALPALWWWAAQVWARPRFVSGWIALIVFVTWWIAVFRVTPDGDGLATTSAGSLSLIFPTSLAAATVSVVASRLHVESDSKETRHFAG